MGKIFSPFYNLYHKSGGVIVVVILLALVPFTLFQVNKNQDIRQRASEPTMGEAVSINSPAGIQNEVAIQGTCDNLHPGLDDEEKKMIQLINNYRVANGLTPYAISQKLNVVAANLAEDEAANGYSAHIDSQGRSMETRLDACGVTYQSAGENAGHYMTTQQEFDGWISSPGHKTNILGGSGNTKYNTMGIARAKRGNEWIWVNDFTNPNPGGAATDDNSTLTDAVVTNAPRTGDTLTLPTGGGAAKPSVETAAPSGSGDISDDPAIWENPTDPSQSVIIGANKDSSGGLNTFNLNGSQIEFLEDGEFNNVDIRYGFPLGGQNVALVAATNRSDDSIAVYKVNPGTKKLENVGNISTDQSEIYGFCMYKSSTEKYYAFTNNKAGVVMQFELVASGNSVVAAGGAPVRTFDVGGQTEGCVADDLLGDFYVGEEAEGFYKYGAEPGDGSTRVQVDNTDSGHLTADTEGMSIYYAGPEHGYLIVSSQGSNEYNVYEREGSNRFIGKFTIAANGGIDAASGTDGLDVTNRALGSAFPQGLFIAHDTSNTGGSASNFKMVPWQEISKLFTPNLTINTDFNSSLPGGGPTPTNTPTPTTQAGVTPGVTTNPNVTATPTPTINPSATATPTNAPGGNLNLTIDRGNNGNYKVGEKVNFCVTIPSLSYYKVTTTSPGQTPYTIETPLEPGTECAPLSAGPTVGKYCIKIDLLSGAGGSVTASKEVCYNVTEAYDDETAVSFAFTLPGIGTNKKLRENSNLVKNSLAVKVSVYDAQGALVKQVDTQALAGFDMLFKGVADLGKDIPNGVYTIKLKVENSLTKNMGIYQLTKGTVTRLNPNILVSGDLNNDNKLDILDYNLLITCYGKPSCDNFTVTGNSQTQAVIPLATNSDLNLDGKVNELDLNIFYNGLAKRVGD